ncbi:hypothetical protein CEXT_20461 [Caerostris extrusa]|uniref:Uncharacterized protein n=1 Tax=Caerostris extrusa TaxID=172846 RepID=A0AAV4WUX3_CAEEX|nr:hypothetical protein CEXT_20461 [Caerostris extrusa]
MTHLSPNNGPPPASISAEFMHPPISCAETCLSSSDVDYVSLFPLYNVSPFHRVTHLLVSRVSPCMRLNAFDLISRCSSYGLEHQMTHLSPNNGLPPVSIHCRIRASPISSTETCLSSSDVDYVSLFPLYNVSPLYRMTHSQLLLFSRSVSLHESKCI